MTDATERTMQIRVLCTAASSSLAFDLRCTVREGLIEFMQREYPQFLPKVRIEDIEQRPGQREEPQPENPCLVAASSRASPQP